jgi:hypothetical protein
MTMAKPRVPLTAREIHPRGSRARGRLLGVIDCLSIGDLAPTESRGDGSQNCFDDMSIVGNA